jgi:hypothetical protein
MRNKKLVSFPGGGEGGEGQQSKVRMNKKKKITV